MTRTRFLAESSPKRSLQADACSWPVLVLVPDRETEARPLAAADLQRLADALRALARGRTSSLQFHMAVAKRVVAEIYGGKVEAFHADGEDGPSFNDLARKLGSAIKKTTLHRALWAYRVRETTPVYRLPASPDAVPNDTGVPTLEQLILTGAGEGVPTLERVPADLLEQLGVSHLYEVRTLTTPLRSDLLSQVLHGQWSVRRLRREIEVRTGAPAPPAILSLLLQLRDVPATIDLTPLATLSEADALHCQRIADKLLHITTRVQAALSERPPAKESA